MDAAQTEQKNNEIWRQVLSGEIHDFNKTRRLFKYIPSSPRCKICNAPFGGVGGPIMRLVYGKKPSNRNPNFCNFCETMAKNNPGGAEVELTMLFADVRGSTALGETMNPARFSRCLNRFYALATNALINTDAMIDKLVGDEIIGLYIIGIAGPDHAAKALSGGRDILKKTGHRDPSGPWLPVGVGIHTGIAFVGSVGSKDNFVDFTALGDAMNTAARIASKAEAGEILMSEDAFRAAHVAQRAEERALELKGKSQPVAVRVLHSW